jgi:hypothetical protein
MSLGPIWEDVNCGLLPYDLLPQFAQSRALFWIDRFDKPNPAVQMRSEVGMSFAILALRSKPDAVREYRLEMIEIIPPDIHALIYDKANQLLSHALVHDPCLAVIRGEPLFVKNCGNVRREPVNAVFKLFVPRKSEVVCISRV